MSLVVEPPPTLEAALAELEALCVSSERALQATAWDELGRLIGDHRRVTALIANELVSAELSPEADASVQRRLRRVWSVRADQLARITHYREQIGERLSAIVRLRSMRRTLGKPTVRSGLGHIDVLQ